ncbi:MAG: c-type cytochrome biogenesis protein CcsB, partial [Brevibacterium linens]
MDVNTDLAMWSNQLIISAMIVYAVAMIFYAFDLFGARELKTSETEVATSAKATTVRRTNRKTATTAVLDRPGDDDSATVKSSRKNMHRGARIGTSLLVLAMLLHVGGVLTRALSVSRVPWGNMMEYVLTATAITVIVFL